MSVGFNDYLSLQDGYMPLSLGLHLTGGNPGSSSLGQNGGFVYLSQNQVKLKTGNVQAFTVQVDGSVVLHQISYAGSTQSLILNINGIPSSYKLVNANFDNYQIGYTQIAQSTPYNVLFNASTGGLLADSAVVTFQSNTLTSSAPVVVSNHLTHSGSSFSMDISSGLTIDNSLFSSSAKTIFDQHLTGVLNIATGIISDLEVTNNCIATSDITVSGDLSHINDSHFSDVVISGVLHFDSGSLSFNNLQIDNNLLTLNAAEIGSGVTSVLSGIEIERGSLPNYDFVFTESTKWFSVGVSGALQAAVTREDSSIATNNGIAFWNETTSRWETSPNLTYSSGRLTVASSLELASLASIDRPTVDYQHPQIIFNTDNMEPEIGSAYYKDSWQDLKQYSRIVNVAAIGALNDDTGYYDQNAIPAPTYSFDPLHTSLVIDGTTLHYLDLVLITDDIYNSYAAGLYQVISQDGQPVVLSRYPQKPGALKYVVRSTATTGNNANSLWYITANINSYDTSVTQVWQPIRFLSRMRRCTVDITSTGTGALAHALGGFPDIINVSYNTGNSVYVDKTSVISSITSTGFTYNTSEYDLTGGNKIVVDMILLKNNKLSGQQYKFVSDWIISNMVTQVPHSLADKMKIGRYFVRQYDTLNNRISIVPKNNVVVSVDNTNINLTWATYSPSSNMQYQIIIK